MGARGRKGKAAKETAKDLELATPGAIEVIKRPEPLLSLTDEQAQIWRTTVDAMRADHFGPETLELLAQYCRHVAAARHIAQLIEQHENVKKGEDLDLEVYGDLLKLQEREGRAMSSLATRMRITQQTQYDKSRKRGSKAPKPWGAKGQD